jgi:peroxiredoxin
MELDAADYRGPYHLGYLYVCSEGKEGEGLELYRRAMELAPEEHGIRAEYARVLYNLGRAAEAEAALLELLDVGGENAYTYCWLGFVEQRKEQPDLARAREYYAKGIARLEEDGYNPADYAAAFDELAVLAAGAGDSAQALDCIDALVGFDVVNYLDAFETDEAFEALRAEARYAQIMERAREEHRQYLEEYCTVMPGQKAPDFKLRDVRGETVKLKDYRGKLVVLNIWATWCGPCRVEIPDLSSLHNDYRDKGVVVLGASTDADMTPEELADAAEALGATYPILIADEKMIRKYIEKSGSIPETYFIGPDGRVLDFIVGTTNRRTLENKVKKYSLQ